MKTYAVISLFAALGLSACGGSGDTSTGGTSGGASGASSGGSAGKGSGGASSGGASSGGASSGGASSGGASSGGASSGGTGGAGADIVDSACLAEDGMACIAYHGPSAGVASITQQCEMDNGTVSAMCPAGATGRCAITQGGNSISQIYYFTDAADLMSAEMICTLTGGAWSVP